MAISEEALVDELWNVFNDGSLWPGNAISKTCIHELLKRRWIETQPNGYFTLTPLGTHVIERGPQAMLSEAERQQAIARLRESKKRGEEGR